MNIQQNVNTLLTMGAVAARTSDTYQTNAAIKSTSKQQIAVNKIVNEDTKDIDPKTFKADPSAYKETLEGHIQHAQQRLDLDEQMAKLDPSKANLNEISESRAYLQSLQEKLMEATDAARNSRTSVPEMVEMIKAKPVPNKTASLSILKNRDGGKN